MAENNKEKESVIEGPGFTVRDRRQVSQEAEKTKRPSEEKDRKSESKKEDKTGEREDFSRQPEDVPLPEPNFTNFVFSLVHSAMLTLGELPDPTTGKTEKNLPMAKHVVDTLGMLQKKTQGNLTDEEQRFIDKSLFDLRMLYVQEKEKARK